MDSDVQLINNILLYNAERTEPKLLDPVYLIELFVTSKCCDNVHAKV
jgi:hypothetical protein